MPLSSICMILLFNVGLLVSLLKRIHVSLYRRNKVHWAESFIYENTPFIPDIAHIWYNPLLFLSAGLILLFYLVFYIFLAGLFTLTMYVMLQTLDDHKPTWQDRLTTPGAVANNTNVAGTGHSRRRDVVKTLRCLSCHSQAWWSDPNQMRPMRLPMTSGKLRPGTCTLRPWISSWHVSLALVRWLKKLTAVDYPTI